MNDRLNSPEASAARLDVDRLLREFYRAQMPHPWPRLVVPKRAAVRPGFARHLLRFALAACVVLGLLTYWGLAGQFGAEQGVPGIEPIMGSIGMKVPRPQSSPAAPVQRLSPVEHQLTPAGNDAKVFEEETPNGRAIILIGPSNAKGPR